MTNSYLILPSQALPKSLCNMSPALLWKSSFPPAPKISVLFLRHSLQATLYCLPLPHKDFSADGFGKFGALDVEEDWACEARRYYFNIVGKYGVQVQNLLKKAATLDIQTICPLHGPILKENLGYYLNLYDIWSSYGVEAEGVFIAYASIHGNTAAAAQKMAEILKAKGAPKVAIADLSRADVAECVEDAFKYGKVILAASSYDAGVFPPMEDFLHHLKSKNYQKRRIGLIENGTWAPCSGKVMRSILETMKSIDICDTVVTIKSSMKADNVVAMEQLADEILA